MRANFSVVKSASFHKAYLLIVTIDMDGYRGVNKEFDGLREAFQEIRDLIGAYSLILLAGVEP